MLYLAEVTVCFETKTKQINRVWVECQFIGFKRVGAHNQQALKG
jgi:hypothetical protein